MKKNLFILFALLLVIFFIVLVLKQQDTDISPKPEDTEVYMPMPPVVSPGPVVSPPPPSDAIILFDGTNLDEWVNTEDGSQAGWILSDDAMIVNKQTGNIRTHRHFRNFQIHIEWQIPKGITGNGQARGNSGLFLATRDGQQGYELQILDSYQNETYVNGMAGSIYKQSPPLVNTSRKPGEWQSFDVEWKAPSFNTDGSLMSPARITVLHNGVLIQNNFELEGETTYIGSPLYQAYYDAPIMLQAHSEPSLPIRFRNIWVRVLK